MYEKKKPNIFLESPTLQGQFKITNFIFLF